MSPNHTLFRQSSSFPTISLRKILVSTNLVIGQNSKLPPAYTSEMTIIDEFAGIMEIDEHRELYWLYQQNELGSEAEREKFRRRNFSNRFVWSASSTHPSKISFWISALIPTDTCRVHISMWSLRRELEDWSETIVDSWLTMTGMTEAELEERRWGWGETDPCWRLPRLLLSDDHERDAACWELEKLEWGRKEEQKVEGPVARVSRSILRSPNYRPLSRANTSQRMESLAPN